MIRSSRELRRRSLCENTDDEKSKDLKFASTDKIERYEHLFRDFFIDILIMDPEDAGYVFVSDFSSLSDLTTHGQGPKANRAEIALFHARIEETYGIGVSDIEDGDLVKIFERITGSE